MRFAIWSLDLAIRARNAQFFAILTVSKCENLVYFRDSGKRNFEIRDQEGICFCRDPSRDSLFLPFMNRARDRPHPPVLPS